MSFDKPIFTYIGMFLAAVAMVFGIVLPNYAAIMWTIAGLLGFGSVAAFRTMIDSKGWKTYFLFVTVVILSALQWFGVITIELYQILLALFVPGVAVTIQQSLAKSPTASIPKLKKAA